jgi:ATP dependent DNA ligase domain
MACIVRRSNAQGATKRGRREASSRISEPPRWIEPQLCKLVDKAPSGPEWVHEVKFDGCRMAARIDHGDVQLLTRSGLDWTEKYPETAAALAKLPVTTAYLDGELCGVGADGVTSDSADIVVVSEGAQQAVAVCYRSEHTELRIADALDRYASALRRLAPLLLPNLRNLPGIVAQAAKRVGGQTGQ